MLRSASQSFLSGVSGGLLKVTCFLRGGGGVVFNLKLHANFELHLVLYLYLLSGIKGGFKSYLHQGKTPSLRARGLPGS